jgi:hypothetical protein
MAPKFAHIEHGDIAFQLKASIRNPPAVKYADAGNTKVNAERVSFKDCLPEKTQY